MESLTAPKSDALAAAKAESEDYRDEIVSYLRAQLIGPLLGPAEELPDPPRVRYLLGVLFPQQSVRSASLEDEDDDSIEGDDEEGASDAPIVASDDWLPSTLGISFYTDSSELRCEIFGSKYTEHPVGRGRRWKRTALAERTTPEIVHLDAISSSKSVLQGHAVLTSTWRPFRDGHLITLALSNSYILEVDDAGDLTTEQRKTQDAECLFQVGFRCEPINGVIREYPTVTENFRDEEEQELALMYMHSGVYAVGHGCSTSWTTASVGASSVATEHLPTYDVPPVAYDLEGFEDLLKLSALISFEKSDLIRQLRQFVDAYGSWLENTRAKVVPADFADAKERILLRISETADRMRSGIEYLAAHDDALDAFRLANRAMLIQMFQTREVINEKSYERNEAPIVTIDEQARDYSWRPFQLAFQLLTLESAAEKSHADRDVVDLIWFPTGGGKTEAYLSLAAFSLFLRRMRLREKGLGTAVITRYTLSLLTSQQFQRAATLICACEYIRAAEPKLLGATPFKIGLWIGDKHTPNHFSKAREQFDALLEEEEPRNPFQLQQCPWCGTLIVPRKLSEDRADYGIRSTESSFAFFCPTDRCRFNELLPVSVIDEALYKEAPSFLLATVDKFAQLAWDEKAGVFFGGSSHEPPSLIIQDELHLLSGPLGTTVGLYEVGIDSLISLNGGRAKVVASTATIRRAPEQIRGLFGRTDSRVFPPSGIDSRDSFYARTANGLGRRYVGILPQSHSTQTAVVNVASAILQAPIACELDGPYRDALWTLVVYHNSLRELGRTINLSRDDIPERIRAWTPNDPRDIPDDGVMELRSNLDGAALPKRLQQLKVEYGQPGVLSIVGCTNMFSVGVDVPRLGLMLVNGQPKSTSEYIQATSRVGRGKVPGLVLALFGATRPRDRSHYEQFRAFHSALYMHVEPTSVTPFSPPSRRRALHALLVLLMRHWGGLEKDNDAGRFEKNSAAVLAVRSAIADRARLIDPDEETATLAELDHLIEQWDALARETAAKNKCLFYRSAGRAQSNLLSYFGKGRLGLWPTLTSMRNVDAECGLAVLGAV